MAGCLLVSSCERCPLCLSAALWARVDQPPLIWQLRMPLQAAPFGAWLVKADRVAC